MLNDEATVCDLQGRPFNTKYFDWSKLYIMTMKTTRYFNYTRTRSDRADIKDKWIQQVVNHPFRQMEELENGVGLKKPVDFCGLFCLPMEKPFTMLFGIDHIRRNK